MLPCTADFGFARFLADGVMAGTLCGSPMYMVGIFLSVLAEFELAHVHALDYLTVTS